MLLENDDTADSTVSTRVFPNIIVLKSPLVSCSSLSEVYFRLLVTAVCLGKKMYAAGCVFMRLRSTTEVA